MGTVSETEGRLGGGVIIGRTCGHGMDKGGNALTGLGERKCVGFCRVLIPL